MNPMQLRSEQLVLYSLLMRPDLVHDIMSRVSSDMMQEPKHKVIFESAVALYVEQKPIDTISVYSSIFKHKDVMYRALAQEEVTGLISKFSIVSGLEIQDAILYLLASSVRTEHKDLGAKLLEMSNADTYDPEEVLHFLQDHITNNKFTDLTKKKEISNEEMVNEIEAQMQRARDKGGISGLPTGFKELDELTTGAQPTNLIIIAARPAMGKSQFALGIYEHLSVKDNKNGIFFSCEMDEPQVAKRVICINGNIRGYSVKFGHLTRDEHLAWMMSSKTFANSSGKILSRAWGIDDIVARCHKEVSEKGLDYIIIDYIQLVHAKGNGSKNSEVEEVTNKLKALANELKIPVYALSQLSRAVEQRPDKKPMLSDLRDSGAIEQDADIVCFLYRPAYYMEFDERQGHPMEKDGYLIIAKHRDGELKDIQLKWEQSIPAWRNRHDPDPKPVMQEAIMFDDSSEIEEAPSAIQPNEDFDFFEKEEPF